MVNLVKLKIALPGTILVEAFKKIHLRRAVFTIFLILHLKIALSGHFWWRNVKKKSPAAGYFAVGFHTFGTQPPLPQNPGTWLIIIILLYIVLNGIVSEKKLW